MSFNACILKLRAICNLDCKYCYMFNSLDRTFERVTALMPIDVALATLDKIRSHLDASGTKRFSVTLHGGEPTLWPTSCFAVLLSQIDVLRQKGYEIDVSIQTNAYKPFEYELLRLFAAHRVSIGISLDGPARFNDAMRVTHAGQGSYDRVINNVGRLIEAGYESLIGGFLTVANPKIPPAAFLDWIAGLPVRRVDILWPIHFNLDVPPWENNQAEYKRRPVYGDWFSDLFQAWWDRDDPSLFIRSFFNLVELRLGGTSHIDALVNDHLEIFVVNTDGRIEYPDYLRVGGDENSNSGINILTANLDDAACDPIFQKLFQLATHLPHECSDCPHRDVCGGGFLAGRTSRLEVLSDRKSVMCADQFRFFSTVTQTIGKLTPVPVNSSDGQNRWNTMAGVAAKC
jgi:uncharacterized protein